jgi:hypothetical protein
VSFSSFHSSDYTISAWVLFQYPCAYAGPILSVRGTGSYIIGQGGWGGVTWGTSGTTLLLEAEGASHVIYIDLRNDRWYHLAVVRQGDRLTAHLDGVAVADIPLDGTNVPDGTLRIGRMADGRLWNARELQFYGKVAEVVLFRRALSAAELVELVTHAGPSGLIVVGRRVFLDRSRVALLGEARTTTRDANWDGANDLRRMPLPGGSRTVLPFAVGDAWLMVQGWARPTGFSHFGYAAFCMDFVIADHPAGDQYPMGTMGAPIHAPCAGAAVKVYDKLSEKDQSDIDNWVQIRGSDGIVRVCQHLLAGSAAVAVDDPVRAGYKIAEVSRFPSNAHLHMACGNSSENLGFVTVPWVFRNYEVRQPDGTWRRVAAGILEPGDVVRRR